MVRCYNSAVSGNEEKMLKYEYKISNISEKLKEITAMMNNWSSIEIKNLICKLVFFRAKGLHQEGFFLSNRSFMKLNE